MQAIKLLWLLQDYHGFRRASNYNKKAGKCPGRSYGESAVRVPTEETKAFCYGRILYWR
jgi:hypothetical protein